MGRRIKKSKRAQLPDDVKYVVVDFMTYKVIERLIKNKSILEPLHTEGCWSGVNANYSHDELYLLVVDKAWCESIVDYMNKHCNRQEGYWTIEPGSGMICYQHLTISGCMGRTEAYGLGPVIRYHLFNLALDDVL